MRLNVWHTIRVGPWKVGKVSGVEMDRIQHDGRIMGLIVESILAAEWPKSFRAAGGCNKMFDLVSISTGRKWEVKTINVSGKWDVSPSWMKGVGRAFDPEAFRKAAATIDGWIFVDHRTRSPDIEAMGVNTMTLFDASKLSISGYRPTKSWSREMLAARIITSSAA